MSTQSTTPQGELAIRTIAMPKDTNANGDIFGGWLVSQMDLAAAIIAKQTYFGRIATVAIDKMTFHQPVYVGDVVCCYAELLKIGHTSMTINIEVWALRNNSPQAKTKVTEGIFTFVALDDAGKPTPINSTNT